MLSISFLGLVLACGAVASRISVESPVYKDVDVYFPSVNSTFYINHNGTLASDSSARTTTANQWANPFPMPTCYGLPLEEADIDMIQEWFKAGQLTSKKLVQCYMSRITQIDEYVNAIMELNPDAIAIAEQRDEEYAAGKSRGPLHGIPFLVKDNLATKDKMETTAGSYALLGSVVPRDAHVVQLLRKKGAVLLGKATLDEWASMRTWSKSSGYSSRGGQSRNSYNLSTAPGGSSSGSCQAVASNMVTIAFGTETDGSVIGPARRASLVGIKPTVGLTSRAGVIPESVHQDTVGSFGRTFKDAVYAFEAIAGIDERDNYTSAQIGNVPEGYDYAQFVSTKDALKGAVFGLPWMSLWNQTSVQNDVPALLKVVGLLESLGATIVNGTEFPHYKEVLDPDGWTWQPGAYLQSVQYRVDVDFYNNIKDYLAELTNTNMKSIEDLIQYNNDFTGVMGGVPGTVAGFKTGQNGFDSSALTKGDMNSTYWENEAFLKRTSQSEGIDAALNYTDANGKQVKIDALLVPSAGGATNLPATAGYPMVTVPVGSNAHSVPFGISLIGTAFSEPTLIKYGSAIEDAVQGRQLPQFYQWWSQLVPVDYSL